MKKIITILFLLVNIVILANASVPVIYNCCINYTYSNGILLDNFENTTNWILGTDSSKEVDIINFKEGNQGLKLITKNGNRSYIDKVINDNFSTTNNFALWVYVYNVSTFDHATLYFTSGTTWSKYFSNSIYAPGFKTGWNKLIFGKNSFTNTGGEDWNNLMNMIRIAIYPASLQNTIATVDDLRYNFSGQDAKIIITFDDGDISVYTKAYPILKRNNQSAVAFVITSFVGNKEKMNLSNLRDLQSTGWDISSHTVDHHFLTMINYSMQYSELKDSYDWLINNKFQKSAGFVAYPFGLFDDAVLEKVKQIYIFGRSTSEGSVQQNLNPTDINDRYIQRIIYVINTTTVQSVKDKINDSINAKQLGILVFHDIVDSNPSKYQYLKTNFQAISDYIKNRNTGKYIMTYSDYVIPNINNFTPVINKTTRIYSNGSSMLLVNNKYDEYMPNMTVRPLSGSIDINITDYNETGGLIRFDESAENVSSVLYDIGDRIPNQKYLIKIYWNNVTKYQDFDVISDNDGHIKYDSTGFDDSRYQLIRPVTLPKNNSSNQNIIFTILTIIIIIGITTYLKKIGKI